MFIEVGASCRNSSSVVSYLYESFSGLKTFVGKKRSNFCAIAYLCVCGFCSDELPFLFIA